MPPFLPPLALTADERQAIYSVLGILASVVGAIVVAKLSHKATLTTTAADREVTSGQLALSIANRAERRIACLEKWRNDVEYEWWPAHEARDRAIENDLRKLDPSVTIPPAVRIPRYVPYRSDDPEERDE